MTRLSADDRAAIADLFAAYSFGYDEQAWNTYRPIWVEDDDPILDGGGLAELEAAGHTFRGVDDIVEHASQRRAGLAEQGISTRHFQPNTVFDEVAGDRVKARTMFLVVWKRDGDSERNVQWTGVYHDDIVRTAAGWRLKRRRVALDS